MGYKQPWCRESLGHRKQDPDLAFASSHILTTILRFLSSKVHVLLISHFLYRLPPKGNPRPWVPGPMSGPVMSCGNETLPWRLRTGGLEGAHAGGFLEEVVGRAKLEGWGWWWCQEAGERVELQG